VSASPSLKELERRVWLQTFEHGLWDVAIGLLLLSFGIGILTKVYWISAILVPAGLPAMRDLARRLIVPRIGQAMFRGRQKRSIVRVQLILAALALVGVGMFAFTGMATREAAPEWMTWIRSHFVIVIGLIWGGALALAGWAVDLPRLYAYGAALLGALVAVDLATTGYHLGHALVAVGGLIMLVGLGLFVRFIRRYPAQPTPIEEEDDGEEAR
jgi:uncharacterized membrane protein SirB2